MWWDFHADENWTLNGNLNSFKTFPIIEATQEKCIGVSRKLYFLMNHFHGDYSRIEKAYSISNAKLKAFFENQLDFISEQHEQSPHIFKRSDWKQLPDADLREQYLMIINQMITKFRRPDFNDGTKVLPFPPFSKHSTLFC